MQNKHRLRHICLLNPQGYVEYPPQLGKTDTGGQTTYIFELAKALGGKKIKVDIITRLFDQMPSEEQVFPNVKIIRIPCGPTSFVPKEKLYEYSQEMAENILEYLYKHKVKYDIINSHYWDGGYVALILAKILNVPHIFTPHSLGKWKKLEMSLEDTPNQALKPIYRYQVRIAAEQKIINRADAIILQAESLRIKILQHYMVDFEKLYVVFPGVDTDVFNPTPSQADKKVILGKNSILTVSRLVPNKGLDRLLDALCMIKNKINFHYYMIGGGQSNNKSDEERQYEQLILEKIKGYHLDKYLTRLNYVPDNLLPAYYRQADLLVFPSRYEPFGITPLEAMACGTPSIVSSTAGCREIIVDGLNGFIVNPHDRKQLSTLILKVLSNPQLKRQLSKNAAFTIKNHYAWNLASQKFIDLFKSFL